MQGEVIVVAPVPIDRDMLKHVVRVLGGGWLEAGGRDEGVVTEGGESVTLRVVEADALVATPGAMAAAGAVRVSARQGPSAPTMALNIANALARRWDGLVLGAPMPRAKAEFLYFEGTVSEMADVASGEPACSLCGRPGLCFALEFTECPEMDEAEREEAVGCVACLKAGRYYWPYRELDVGSLTPTGLVLHRRAGGASAEEPPAIPASAQEEMRRTPNLAWWQESLWLTHCSDFMVYLGRWLPQDFHDRSPSGDGRDLFGQMTADDDHCWWDRRVRAGERGLEGWYCTYHAFRCRHCRCLRGYCDVP